MKLSNLTIKQLQNVTSIKINEGDKVTYYNQPGFMNWILYQKELCDYECYFLQSSKLLDVIKINKTSKLDI